jgi:tyrosine-protein phosphatase YwqE
MISFFKRKKNTIATVLPDNFIDIHSHLLHGIDDGSKNLDESVALIKRMNAIGIKNFVVTPHIMEGVWENNPTIIKKKLAELTSHLKDLGITDVKIKAAAEYMLDSNFNKLLASKKLLTVKDAYILVEMSYLNAPVNLYEILFQIQIAGYKPILAHPERYSFYHKNFKEYQKLKDAGCHFQLNLLSLTNYYGKGVNAIAMKLLKENMIDFVGSDTHHQRHLDTFEKISDKKHCNLLHLFYKIIYYLFKY